MSILAEIADRIQEGRLELLQHAMGVPPIRRLYVTAEVRAMLLGPWSDPEMEACWQALRAEVDRFIAGEALLATFRPNEKSSLLKRLLPTNDEVWEFRNRRPSPGIRLFGRFVELNCFVATNWEMRHRLGGPMSPEFRAEIVRCRKLWANLFFAYAPLTGGEIHDYISNAIPV